MTIWFDWSLQIQNHKLVTRRYLSSICGFPPKPNLQVLDWMSLFGIWLKSTRVFKNPTHMWIPRYQHLQNRDDACSTEQTMSLLVASSGKCLPDKIPPMQCLQSICSMQRKDGTVVQHSCLEHTNTIMVCKKALL